MQRLKVTCSRFSLFLNIFLFSWTDLSITHCEHEIAVVCLTTVTS